MATKKQARAASESAAFLLVGAAILILANMLGPFLNVRVDTTEKELFSLSDGSKRLASSLDDQMEIRAYFSEDLPPPHNSTERYARDLLTEYRDASGGKVTLRFIHPQSDEDKQAAERDGVQRVQDQKLESDSFSVHEGYRGISFHYLGDSKAIPRVDTTAGMEYEITQTIKELVGEKIDIGVLTGHEGPTLAEGLSSLKGFLPTYNFKEVDATKEIPTDLRALLVIHPETALSEAELQHLNQYVMRGGSLAVFGGMLKVEASTGMPTATVADSGLNSLLEKWGAKVEPELVADAQCGRARLPTQLGIPIAVPYPPVPIVMFDEKQREHPALFRLDQVALPYASRVSINDNLKGDKEVQRTILARSTKASWLMSGDSIDLKSREPNAWSPTYDGPHIMGVAIEGKIPSAYGPAVSSTPEGEQGAQVDAPDRSETTTRVLVLGSGFFFRDEFMPQPQPGMRRIAGGGVALALNAIDWRAQDSDLIAIRPKTVEDPTLRVPANVKDAEATVREAIKEQDEEKAEKAFEERKAAVAAWDQKKSAYRWGNTLALPAAFALIGIVRWRVRRARRSSLKL